MNKEKKSQVNLQKHWSSYVTCNLNVDCTCTLPIPCTYTGFNKPKCTGFNKISQLKDFCLGPQAGWVVPLELESCSVSIFLHNIQPAAVKVSCKYHQILCSGKKELFFIKHPSQIYSQNTLLLRWWWWDPRSSPSLTAAYSVPGCSNPHRSCSAPDSSLHQHNKIVISSASKHFSERQRGLQPKQSMLGN